MSIPKKNISDQEMRKPEVSINFQRLDENQLVAYFQKPSHVEDAFREVIRRFQEKVYFYVRNMLVSHDDANDVTQNTFIKIWQNLSTFRGDSKLSTWILRIASNEAISHLRKRKLTIDFDEAQPELADQLIQDDYLSAQGVELKLAKAMCYLPYKQKLVFVLRYFEDLSYEEIAELTQTTVGALKSSYHHAVKKIEIYLDVLR
ncbi:MAG: RNA polymerase sigma factor [Bacteroidia bacterium]|nr:RNA polymerase sigma factor [Bacteroidia bacterium]